MATMQGNYSVQSLSGLQVYGCFQYFEAKIPFHRRLSHLKYSSRKSGITFGLALSNLGLDKPKLRSVDLGYVHHRQRRGSRKSELCDTKVDILRSLKSNRSVRVPRNSLDNDTTSTTASNDVVEQQDKENSDKNPEVLEKKTGVATNSGLSSLDAYFSKLKGETESSKGLVNATTSNSVSTIMIPVSKQHKTIVGPGSSLSGATNFRNEGKEVKGLKALDAYFEKLNPKKPDSKPVKEEVPPGTRNAVELTEEELFIKSLVEANEDYEKHQSSVKDDSSAGDYNVQVTSKVAIDDSDLDFPNWDLPEERSTNSNLINILVATNIAVYLFGLASPHEALGITDSSLPFVYGAKVNELMLAGQWWRFITPMFLHASLLHVGLGSWALLSFGPAVESAYGTLGFAMIYFLGGIFGDLMSFFHTTEWTVSGTGPIYALVGTWVVYLLKNREVIGKEVADDMIRKVVILSALNVAICNSLPIDDWTHLGAILIGTVFGILASPTMQLNVTLKEVVSDKKDEDAAYLWFNNRASPARLTLIFALCLGIFFILYQLGVSGSNDFDL